MINNYKSDLAPILLFVYNRPWHLKKTVDALIENKYADSSNLIIYSDGPKNENDLPYVNEVRRYIKSVKGFNFIQVIEREKNYGLGDNIISGVTEIVDKYGNVIVLEDDLITSPYFLQFMNEGLIKYKNAENVISIHGYIYPLKKKLPDTFFIKGADCLGWATWKDKWNLFEEDGRKLLKFIEENKMTKEFDLNNSYPYTQMLRDQIEGKNSSWAVRWYASAFLKNMLTLYPGKSLIFHSGNDGSGTNFPKSEFLDVKIADSQIVIKDIPIKEDVQITRKIGKYLKNGNISLIKYVYRRIKRFLISLNDNSIILLLSY